MRRVEVRRGEMEGEGVGGDGLDGLDGLDGVVGGNEAVPGVRRMRWK